jgi:2-oxoglutarate dehydrogenase complex dehydrogenase (E1) component-like enzyme
VKGRLFEAFASRLLVRGVTRAESASPATGPAAVHKQEQAQLLQEAFADL